jgi:predicted RNase H-like HicB family nuclease
MQPPGITKPAETNIYIIFIPETGGCMYSEGLLMMSA